VFAMVMSFSCTMLRDRLIPDICCCDSHWHISYLTLICIHRYLPCYIWHMIPDTSTCHAILIIWYLIPVLAMLYLLLISDTGAWHATLITWYLTPILTMLYLTIDMLSPGTSIFDLILWHLTGYYNTWHLYLFAYSWLSLFTGTWHDYYIITRHLVLLNSCTPELLYTWTPEIGRLLILLLILYSCWFP